MNNFVIGLVFLVLALLGVVLRKTYFSLPITELKRRAAKHDKQAARLYRAVAYGNSLKTLLWLYIGLTAATSIILLARVEPVWLSLLIVSPILWIVFSLVPASRTTKIGTNLTILLTPLIAWLLNYLHPLLSRSADVVERHYVTSEQTGLYERDDLLALIKKQKQQADNRFSDEELEIAQRALSFDKFLVGDILTPRKEIKTIMSDDVVGPILIDELHKSKQAFVLVRDGTKGPFVGTLAFGALSLNSKGLVRDVMDSTVYYLHENDSLSAALHAFFVTNKPLFVVVDGSGGYVGVITIESILHKLLGHLPGDDFDQYSDLNAVASRHLIKNLVEDDKDSDETSVKTEDEVVE